MQKDWYKQGMCFAWAMVYKHAIPLNGLHDVSGHAGTYLTPAQLTLWNDTNFFYGPNQAVAPQVMADRGNIENGVNAWNVTNGGGVAAAGVAAAGVGAGVGAAAAPIVIGGAGAGAGDDDEDDDDNDNE